MCNGFAAVGTRYFCRWVGGTSVDFRAAYAALGRSLGLCLTGEAVANNADVQGPKLKGNTNAAQLLQAAILALVGRLTAEDK